MCLLDAFEADLSLDSTSPYHVLILQCGEFTLAEYAQHQRPFPINKTKAILTDIIMALEACASHDIVTADLKPQNIMYFRDSRTFD